MNNYIEMKNIQNDNQIKKIYLKEQQTILIAKIKEQLQTNQPNNIVQLKQQLIENIQQQKQITKYQEKLNISIQEKRKYLISLITEINNLNKQIKNTNNQEQIEILTQKRDQIHNNNRQEICYLIKEIKSFQKQEQTITTIKQNDTLTNKIKKIKNTRVVCSVLSIYIFTTSIILSQEPDIILLSGTVAFASLITKIIQTTISKVNKNILKFSNELITESYYLLHQQHQLNLKYEDYKKLYITTNKLLQEKTTINNLTTFKDYKTKIKTIDTLSYTLATSLDNLEEKYNFNIETKKHKTLKI